ncbi:MAG: hypothetical protein J6U16_03170 [Ruminococcus sp.]|nr:hypothetical protein [Ruminococcus sp.]
MNRPMRKLIAFSAAAAMLANIPLIGANAKYVAEQVTDKEFDTLVQFPDRNLYIEHGSADNFITDQQLVVVATDGTTKLISLAEGLAGSLTYYTTTMGSYPSTTMGIYDYIMPTSADYGFDFNDPSYRFSLSKGTMIVNAEGKQVLVDADGKALTDMYDHIVKAGGGYFAVSNETSGKTGIIDSTGKLIFEAEGMISLTADGKSFFVDGDGKDYFTDLTGKAVSAEYEELVNVVSSANHWFFHGEIQSDFTGTSFYRIKKDGKYALFDATDFKTVTDYYDQIQPYSNYDAKYALRAMNHLYDKDGNVIENKYDNYYLDQTGKVAEQSTDLVYDEDVYEHYNIYYLDENGKEFDSGMLSGAKGGSNSYFLHIKEKENWNYKYEQLLDKDMNVLLEGDDIKIESQIAIVVKNGEKLTVYNGKLENVGEFDKFSRPSGGLGSPNLFIGKNGDKCTIFNNKLEPVMKNVSASAENISVIGNYDENWNMIAKAYYFKDGDGVKLYDSSFKLIKSKAVAEGQSYLINDDLDIFTYDSAYNAEEAGEYFYLYNNEAKKVVDKNGKTVGELPADAKHIRGTNFFYSQKDSELCFYNCKGELLRTFNSSIQFPSGTPGEYTYVINGKDEATGEKASYVYDITSNTIIYSQVGKYDKIELEENDLVKTYVYPEGTDTDSQADLWSNDSGFKTGFDKINGTQLIAPVSGLNLSTSRYCFGGYSNSDWRDNAIDIIYSDGSNYYDGQEFCAPATGNNDSGYIVVNGVYIPVKDFAPYFATANHFDVAIRTQYDNYVVIKDGKWGMASPDGKVLGEMKYNCIFEFADGIAYAVEPEDFTYTEKEYDHYDEETKKSVYKDVEKTKTVYKYGIITKDGVELETPAYYNNRYSSPVHDEIVMYRIGGTFYTSRIVGTDTDMYGWTFNIKANYSIYKGRDYFNDFTAKYGYDTAVQYGDLLIVSKDGLKGIVTTDNEEVLPIEYAEILSVPADEAWLMKSQTDEIKKAFADQHYSSPISDLEDGSKLVNVKTPEGRIKAYKISEETTTSTTSTTTTTTTTQPTTTTTTTTTQSTTTTTTTTTQSTTTTTTTTTQPTTTTTTATTQPTTTTTTATTQSTTTTTSATTTTSTPTTTTTSTTTATTSATTTATSTTATTTTTETTTAATTTTEATTTESATPKPEEAVVGIWNHEKTVEANGEEVPNPDNVKSTLELRGDKTGKLSSTDGTKTEEFDIVWRMEDNKVIISTSEPDDDIMTLVYDSVTHVLSARESDDETARVAYFGKADAQPLGDVNNDGKIDAKDASAILVEYSKMSTGGEGEMTAAQKDSADVDADGKIDAKDASAILAYYAFVSTASGDVPTLKEYLTPKEA